MISSIPVVRAELHVSAISTGFYKHRFLHILSIYMQFRWICDIGKIHAVGTPSNLGLISLDITGFSCYGYSQYTSVATKPEIWYQYLRSDRSSENDDITAIISLNHAIRFTEVESFLINIRRCKVSCKFDKIYPIRYYIFKRFKHFLTIFSHKKLNWRYIDEVSEMPNWASWDS